MSLTVADADSRRWENDDEAHDSKIVRNSHLSPALVEKVRPPCHLISDASPWMEYCAEQNPQNDKLRVQWSKSKEESDS